jgi:hypothetical protein
MIRLNLSIGLLAFACVGLEAQTSTMQASIPFAFQINKTQMPAGEYVINYSRQILTLREERTHKTAVVLTVPDSRGKMGENGLLVFNRYADEYFFSKVWAPNSSTGGALLKTPRERELASRAGEAQPTAIASRSK